MKNLTNELKAKLLGVKSVEEVIGVLQADGQEISAEDAAHLWEELTRQKAQDGQELSLDELDSVSGGASMNWATDGCASTVEYGSWCDSNDNCIIWSVTYDFQPTGRKCPNCGMSMYLQNTAKIGGDNVEQYKCKVCGSIVSETTGSQGDHVR